MLQLSANSKGFGQPVATDGYGTHRLLGAGSDRQIVETPHDGVQTRQVPPSGEARNVRSFLVCCSSRCFFSRRCGNPISRRIFMMQNRRDAIAHSAKVAAMLATLGLLPALAHAQAADWNKAAFDTTKMDELMKALGVAGAPEESPDVTLTGPDIAENGAVVPIGASSAKSGVERLLILVEKNPALLAAMFELTDRVEPNLATRVKMGQTSDVYAVALMDDGKALFARKEIKVTLGGCGG